MDENAELIERIDTSKPIRHNTRDIVAAIIEIQVKLNEIIDVVNLSLTPEEPFDDDEDEEPTIVSPSNRTLGSKNKK